MTIESILWRGIYLRGHEACRLRQLDNKWRLEGTAVFSHEDRPCRLSYVVVCDSDWNTLTGTVEGWLDNKNITIDINVNADHRWHLNGEERPNVAGCTDLDLNFSPSTNLLPIRRLNLAVGEQAEVRAAWLRFPSFELEHLSQAYKRVDELTYRYESAGGKFVADLTVDAMGFVTNYPGLWVAHNSE